MNIINPLAAICSAQMLLQTIGEDAAAARIEDAVKYVTGEKLEDMGAGRMGYSTTEVGDLVAEKVAD